MKYLPVSFLVSNSIYVYICVMLMIVVDLISDLLQGEGPKGQFDVKQLRIVEPMEINLFGREYTYPFQVSKKNM